MSNIVRLTLLLCLVSLKLSSQELEQDSQTQRWHFSKIFDTSHISKSDVYSRILSNYITESQIIQSQVENKKIVIRYMFRLGTFKYAKVTEPFDIKEGRLRWRISDIVYLKAVSGLSKFKELDKTSDKSIIKKINKLLPEGIDRVLDKVVNATEERDDW